MTVRVKICGITSQEGLAAAVTHGASYVGFVHFPASPRHLTPEAASVLRATLPVQIQAVSVVVDASDEMLERVCAHVMPDVLQLHGRETPARMHEIRERFGVPVMKALAISSAEDLAQMAAYAEADLLLFDAKPPAHSPLPGGNATSFDWALLRGITPPTPWMLSGGLTPSTIAEAIRISGSSMIDVSSGVETAPGIKDAQKIAAFIHAAGMTPNEE